MKMRMRYTTKKWRTASCAALGVILTTVLVGATPLAFAVEDDGLAERRTDVADGSAFRLGHVSIACADAEASGEAAADEEADDGSGSDGITRGERLEMGEPQERTYRITNQGETSYIRLASHTLLGELDHNNDLAVMEQVFQETEGDDDAEEKDEIDSVDEAKDDGDADESGEGGGTPSSPVEPLWRFADDGYWYRTTPLEVGEVITITVSVVVPFEEEWTAVLLADASADVVETFDVQALQARNKAIDLESPDPWGLDGMELRSWTDASLSEEGRSTR